MMAQSLKMVIFYVTKFSEEGVGLGLFVGTDCKSALSGYFLLKIKILAKRERELTTKFAIARNGC